MSTIDLNQPAQGPIWFSFRDGKGTVQPDPTLKHTLADLVLDFICNPAFQKDLPFDPTQNISPEELGQRVVLSRLETIDNVPRYAINLAVPGFQEALAQVTSAQVSAP